MLLLSHQPIDLVVIMLGTLVQLKHLAESIKSVCDNYEAHFMDAAQYAEASLIDTIHMNEENHKKLAKAIADKIYSIRNNIY